MVDWKIELSDGQILSGKTDDGSWRSIEDQLKAKGQKILKMSIANNCGGGTIDSGADGYFLGNKLIAILPSTININLVGIGYWKKHENVARIKWYDASNMSLVFTEARLLNECGISLVKNPC